jgi:hypothetical protein
MFSSYCFLIFRGEVEILSQILPLYTGRKDGQCQSEYAFTDSHH